jgi:hypothetical protein
MNDQRSDEASKLMMYPRIFKSTSTPFNSGLTKSRPVWTEMFLEKFFHRPAEIQRVLLVLPFSEIVQE